MLLIIFLNVFDVPKEFSTALNLIQISKSLELYFVKLLIGFISKFFSKNMHPESYIIIRKYLILYIKLLMIGHPRITNTDYFLNKQIYHTPQKGSTARSKILSRNENILNKKSIYLMHQIGLNAETDKMFSLNS